MKRLLLLLVVPFLLLSCGSGEAMNEDDGRVTKVADEIFLDDEASIVQFSADWCSWCKKQYPNLVEVSKQYSNINFYLVDIDESPELKSKYGVKGVPMTALFINGEPTVKTTGYMTYDELRTLAETVK